MEHKLYRSRSDRMISGVCGGIAEYFEVDPTLIRLIAVFGAAISFGTLAIAYLVMSIVVPETPVEPGTVEQGTVESQPADPGSQPVAYPTSAAPVVPPSAAAQAADVQSAPPTGEHRAGVAGAIFGAILLVLGIVFLAGQFGLFSVADVVRFWPLILIAIGIGIMVRGGRR